VSLRVLPLGCRSPFLRRCPFSIFSFPLSLFSFPRRLSATGLLIFALTGLFPHHSSVLCIPPFFLSFGQTAQSSLNQAVLHSLSSSMVAFPFTFLVKVSFFPFFCFSCLIRENLMVNYIEDHPVFLFFFFSPRMFVRIPKNFFVLCGPCPRPSPYSSFPGPGYQYIGQRFPVIMFLNRRHLLFSSQSFLCVSATLRLFFAL